MHDPNDGIAGEMLTQERGAEVRIERVLDFGEHVRAERIRLGIGRSLPAGVLDHGEIAFGFEAAPQATEVAARDMAAARAIADAEHVVVHLMQEDQAVALLLAHRQHVRHGTTDLFAALDLTAGTVIGETHRRHRRVEFRQFLDTIDRRTPRALDVHLILDNSSIHKTPLIHRWLAKRPRFHVHFVHFTSTSASWLNLVESWFAILTKRQRTRGVHRSTAALERAIRDYIAHADREAKPFVWTKTADEIFESVARSCQRTNSDH